jgi:DNA-binding GntR family transcriptional regulator
VTAGVNQPPLLADRAYEAVRDLIVTLGLPPGSPIQEDRLGAELGVGRTPLREAIKRLASESLVRIYPRQGTFVSEINIADHALIADVRRQLEGHAAERAAHRSTPADRTELARLIDQILGRSTDRETLMRLDTEIHRAVYSCAHNPYLATTLSHYYNLSLRIWYLFLDRLPPVDHTSEHLPMLEAIIAGDADRARAIAVGHVEQFDRAVRAAI